jgi:GDP-L-fucose synthase
MIHSEVLRSFHGRRVLVTGGTGLIGRQVVDILTGADALVRVVSLDDVSIDNAECVKGDLTEFSFCREISDDVDDVFHIAGIGASVASSKTMIASHFVPTLMMNVNILEACRLNHVSRVVFTSSVGAYAPADVFREEDYRMDSSPMDFAGWAKRMAEAQIHAYHAQYGLKNYAIVRPSNVYGPGDNFDPSNALVIPSLLYRIYHGENPLVIWGDGSAVRDFVYSRDVAEGIVLALFHGTDGGFVNLGSGVPCSLREMAETLKELLGVDYRFDASKPSGVQKRIMDIAKAKNTIRYDPETTLRDGIKKTWEWFLAHPEEYSLKMNYFRKDHETV